MEKKTSDELSPNGRFSNTASATALRGLQICLLETRLVSFKFDSVFSLVFQRDGRAELPLEARLVLANEFEVGDPSIVLPRDLEVEAIVSRQRLNQSIQAFHLMSLVHDRVCDISLSVGQLVISFQSGASLKARSLDSSWEYSWLVYVPVPGPCDESTVSVNCDSKGELYSSWAPEANQYFEML